MKREAENPKYLEFQAAIAKLDELRTQLSAMERRKQEVLNDINRRSNEIHGLAKRFLSGQEPAKGRESTESELRELYLQMQGIAAAIKLQENNVDVACSAASREACIAFEAQHVRNVRNFLVLLVSASQSQAKMLDDLKSIETTGLHVEPWLPRLSFDWLYDPTDYNSHIARFFVDCFQHRFIESDDIPREWLEEWQHQVGVELKNLHRVKNAIKAQDKALAMKPASTFAPVAAIA